MTRLIRFVALAMVASASGAVAQPAPKPQPAPDRVDAQSLMQSGLKLYQAKDYLGALAVFKDAYTRFPSAKILLNIGTTQRQLDRKADAANTYQHYLDSSDADPAKRGEVERVLAELDRAVSILTFDVKPSGAKLDIHDEPITSKQHRVTPGDVTIRGQLDGYQTTHVTVAAMIGQTHAVTVNLTKLPEASTVGVTAPLKGTDSGNSTSIGAVATPSEPMSRVAALVSVHADALEPAVAIVAGVSVRAMRSLEVQAAALIGATSGGYFGATYSLLETRLRPQISIGIPLFASNGARFGARGAAGVEFAVMRHLSVIAELGVERMLNPEPDRKKTMFVPAVTALGRL